MRVKKKKEKTTVGNLPKKVDGLVATVDGLSITVSDLTKTVDKLALEMRNGFVAVDVKIKESEKRIIKDIDAKIDNIDAKIDTKIDTKIDELAVMTKHGFDSIGERLDDLEKTNTREHEEIKLRQDEVPYRFELVELQKRVDVLKRKAS